MAPRIVPASRYESTRFPPVFVRCPRAEGVAEVAVAGGRGGHAHCSAIAAGSNRMYLPSRMCGIRASLACRSNHCGSTERTTAAASAVSRRVGPDAACAAAVRLPEPNISSAIAAPSRRRPRTLLGTGRAGECRGRRGIGGKTAEIYRHRTEGIHNSSGPDSGEGRPRQATHHSCCDCASSERQPRLRTRSYETSGGAQTCKAAIRESSEAETEPV
jgi:hypothetical protein